ncbi:MAG: TolC family protein [Rickettsiales bacterium]|nr:TolC family protein [Rickettsiales bacterium]
MRHLIFGLLCTSFLTANIAYAQDLLDTPEPLLHPQQSSPEKSIKEKNVESAGSAFTLDNAITKALADSPRLKAFNSNVAAAKGELRQSGAWENPEIGVEAENIAGDRNYKGFDSAEVTYGLSQTLQIGGKISARENIAGKGLEIASLDYQSAALDVIRDVTTAYAEAIAAQENVRLAKEQKELAEDVLKSVSVRVGAAAAPLIQKSRAEVEAATALIAYERTLKDRDIIFKNLATLLGQDELNVELDSAAFYATSKPDVITTEEKLNTNPEYQKLNTALEQSRARLDLEQANAIPDPRLSVGMRDFRDSGDKAFILGVSLPIPVFNANRGNIEKARSEISKTESDNRHAILMMSTEMKKAKQQMEAAYFQAKTLNEKILPSADKAFRLAREGYGLGRFPYIEVLDAQRSLFDVKQQRIAALKEFHSSKAQVERLTAMHLPKIQDKGAINAE